MKILLLRNRMNSKLWFGVIACCLLLEACQDSHLGLDIKSRMDSKGIHSGVKTLGELSLYERQNDSRILVGQSLIIAMRWDGNGKPIHRLGANEISLLRDIQPGGVILFAPNLKTVSQTRSLIRQIQDVCLIPPFIAIDEEGGRVSRLATSQFIKATRIPPAASLGGSGPTAVWKAYSIIGSELSALGVNMDFAPVADIDENALATVVGDRAFSSNPFIATEMVRLAVIALQEQGVCAVLKHFPGHGRSQGDTHSGKQVVNADWKTLLGFDLLPFKGAINSGVAAMMTAHIEYPQIDARKLPVSMSDIILAKLQHELGFTGLIITDALDMRGILSSGKPGDVGLASIEAGVDMLLCPENAVQIRDTILNGLTNHKIKEERIKDTYHRILMVKNNFGILGKKVDLSKNTIMTKKVGSRKFSYY